MTTGVLLDFDNQFVRLSLFLPLEKQDLSLSDSATIDRDDESFRKRLSETRTFSEYATIKRVKPTA